MKTYKRKNHNEFLTVEVFPSYLSRANWVEWTREEQERSIATLLETPQYKVADFEHGSILQVPCRGTHDRFERNFDGSERRC